MLHTDADMNKADWMTAGAAMVGVLGVGLGVWWADAAAAVAISLSIVRDGFGNLREVISNLMDEVPKTTDHTRFDPLPQEMEQAVKRLPWVDDAQVRLVNLAKDLAAKGEIIIAKQRGDEELVY